MGASEMIFTKASRIKITQLQIELSHLCYVERVESNGDKYRIVKDYPEVRFINYVLTVWAPTNDID